MFKQVKPSHGEIFVVVRTGVVVAVVVADFEVAAFAVVKEDPVDTTSCSAVPFVLLERSRLNRVQIMIFLMVFKIYYNKRERTVFGDVFN